MLGFDLDWKQLYSSCFTTMASLALMIFSNKQVNIFMVSVTGKLAKSNRLEGRKCVIFFTILYKKRGRGVKESKYDFKKETGSYMIANQ